MHNLANSHAMSVFHPRVVVRVTRATQPFAVLCPQQCHTVGTYLLCVCSTSTQGMQAPRAIGLSPASVLQGLRSRLCPETSGKSCLYNVQQLVTEIVRRGVDAVRKYGCAKESAQSLPVTPQHDLTFNRSTGAVNDSSF